MLGSGRAGPGPDPRDRPSRGEPYALVAGTVFRPPGFALAGARLTLAPEAEGQSTRKIRKQEAVSDSRGEFAFRVPPGPMRYTLKVSAKGFAPQQKKVAIQGEERTDVFFQLEPARKQN